MTESEARQVLLLRAFEDPVAAPWSAADRDAVSREAEREVGGDASPEHLIARRAELAMARLLRGDGVLRAAHAAGTLPAWVAPLLLSLALATGLAIDGLGGTPRINLFALPLLGMLAWNLVVYVLVAGHRLRRHGGKAAPRPLPALISRLGSTPRSSSPALARFAADWAQASASLNTARLATVLHAAAAVLALGVMVSMYARGSFFEFRAGWDSTFFDVSTMHRFVTLLLGPAAWLSGIGLPDEAAFAALRLDAGPGEVAARWIHLYALTLVGIVVLPRTLLAAWAGWQAHRMALAFALPLHEGYFQRLLPGKRGAAVAVRVLPYSYHLPHGRSEALRAVLVAECVGEPDVQVSASVPLGGEDDPERWLPGPAHAKATMWVALFPLAATPERETHGAFLQVLAARLPAGARLIVLVDEAGFRERFGATDGARRLEQRREAWRGLMRDLGHAPRFADLSPPQPGP